jgi:hypothetical protein
MFEQPADIEKLFEWFKFTSNGIHGRITMHSMRAAQNFFVKMAEMGK